MQLNPSSFNQFLDRIGQLVTWARGYACPCVNPASGSPKPNCPVCKSKGHTWDVPVPCKTGVAGRDLHQKWAQFGMWNQGDVVLSIPSDSPVYNIGQYDRVVMLNRSEAFSINMIAGVNTSVPIPYVSIDRVAWMSPDGKSEILGTPPVVNPDGSLSWPGGMPPNGATYSLSGRRRQEFFCFNDQPWDRPHFGGAQLPRNVVLRRFDLFGRG
ncbi:TPA: hypothetical protein QDB28_004018 [Burkholderia vietnamiensis]|nr:hypothetical protein [Burkholderia vietnamiensis]